MSLTPLAVATEPASEPSQHNDSISTSDGTNTDATVQATESPSEPIAEDKPNHTVQVNLNAYPSYRAYVQILAQTRYPALKIVLEFLDSDQNDGSEKQPCSKTDRQCILCCYFHLSLVALFADNTHTECCTFERHSGEPSEKLLEGMLQSMTELAQDSQPKKLQRFIIIVQDIKPRGMKVSFYNLSCHV